MKILLSFFFLPILVGLTTIAFAQPGPGPGPVPSEWVTNGTSIYNANSGNVGIGIASPSTKLEVKGTTSASSLNLNGTTSGTISISPQAITGSYNLNLPITSGSSGEALISGGGGSSAMSWATIPKTVASIAALQEISPPDSVSSVLVTGSQGAGSVFVWVVGSLPCNATTGGGDGGTTFCADDGSGGYLTTGYWQRQTQGYAYPAWFGASCDGVKFSDGAITASSKDFTSTEAIFSSADVGKTIAVYGAGAVDGLETTIAAVVNSHEVTLTDAASTTVTDAGFVYGTVETTKIQNWLNSAESNNLVAKLPVGLCGITTVTLNGSTTILGQGPSSGFFMTGTNAEINRGANISNVTWKDFSIFGDGISANLQNPLYSNGSYTIASAVFTNINIEYVNNALDLTRVFDAVVQGGQYGPTMGDGATPGTGYGIAIGGNSGPADTARNIRISDVLFYRNMRHDLYDGADAVVQSANNQFVQHRYGLTYTGEYASLEMSRGSNFSDVGSTFYDCYDSPFGIDNDEQQGVASTSISMAGETVSNCPFPGYLGFANTGSATVDNDAVSITGLTWHASPNSAGTLPNGNAITIYGCNVCTVSGTFDFSSFTGITANVLPIILHNVQDRGPFSLTIDANARINSTGSNNALVEIGTEQAALGSTAEIYISPQSHVIGAPMIFPDAEIQNSKIIAPGNPDVKNITGATPYVPGYVNFNLTQSAATNVTNFLGGSENQIINVVVGDGNTTFINSTSLHTRTGADVAAAVSGVMYQFKYVNGSWRQL